MNKTRTNLFFNNLSWIYYAKVMTQVIGLISTYLILSKLPVTVFGEYTFLINIFIIIQIINVSPLQNVINRFLPELSQSGETNKIRTVVLYSYSIGIIGTLFFFGVAYLTKDWISGFFKLESFSALFCLLLIYSIVTLSKNIAYAISTSLLLNKKTAHINIVNSVLRLILYLIFYKELTVSSLIQIESLLASIFFIQLFIIIKKYLNVKEVLRKIDVGKKSNLKYRMIKFGFFSFFNELGTGIIGKTSDYYIIAAFSNQYSVGLYSFAYRIYDIIYKILPMQEFITVLRPLFFQKYSTDYDLNSFYNFYNFLVKLMLPLFTLPAILFLLFGKDLIEIFFSGKYIDAYYVTLIILATNISSAFFYPVGITLQLKERMDILFYSKIIVIFSIFAGIIGMKYFDIIGVAIATGLGDILKHLFILLAVRKTKLIKYRMSEYKNYLYVFLIPTILIFSLNQFIEYNGYSLFFVIILFILIEILFLVKWHSFNKSDLELLEKISKNNVGFTFIKNSIVKISQNIG